MFKVLIVDDEASTRNGLMDFVPWNRLGAEQVKAAENGRDALAVVREFKPDIVISDIRMPGMSGIELAQRLRVILPHCKLIFLSGYADKENLKQAIELQACRFLEKPIRRGEIVSVVEAIAAQIENDRRNEQDMRKKSEGQHHLVRQILASDLVHGLSAELIRQRIELAEIDPFSYALFTSAIVRFDSNGVGDRERLCSACDALCEGLSIALETSGLCISFMNGTEITLQLFEPAGHVLKPEDLYYCIQDTARRVLGEPIPFFLSVGESQCDIMALARSYSFARNTMAHLFYMGYGNFASSASGSATAGTLPNEPPAAYKKALRLFDQGGAASALRSFHQQVKANRPDPGKVRKGYAEMLHALTELSREVSAVEDRSGADILRVVYDADTLDRIHELCMSELDAVFERLVTNKESGQIVTAIREIVAARYADTELSIESLAGILFLSGTYLCHVFKKKTGMTINGYITGVRMEKAREFLCNQRIKVTSVAGMVGYTSPDHFGKLFLRHNGVRPAEFRDLCASGRARLKPEPK